MVDKIKGGWTFSEVVGVGIVNPRTIALKFNPDEIADIWTLNYDVLDSLDSLIEPKRPNPLLVLLGYGFLALMSGGAKAKSAEAASRLPQRYRQ